jgi:hypothetical protein
MNPYLHLYLGSPEPNQTILHAIQPNNCFFIICLGLAPSVNRDDTKCI